MLLTFSLEPDVLIAIKGNTVGYKMTIILVTMISVLWGIAVFLQTPISGDGGRYLPCPKTQPSKRSYEIFALCYTPIWIACFGMIVGTGAYEHFTAWTYNYVCIGLALPFLLQPLLAPGWPDNERRFLDRYSTKVNVWIAIFSFIGNYWFTHYFYSILKAKYTMPAHRFNDVPIALYFATHFYFSTYHCFSNLLLRKITTSYKDTFSRQVLFWGAVICFSYFTAFMETLTISSFPYYSFENRDMAYTVGSAFYGIYFLVSFPMFFYFDYDIDSTASSASRKHVSIVDAIVCSCGCGMIVLCLLDFVRLYLNMPLFIQVQQT